MLVSDQSTAEDGDWHPMETLEINQSRQAVLALFLRNWRRRRRYSKADGQDKTAGGLAPGEDHGQSAASALSPRGETKLPEPTTEADVSTVQPLPSSTRAAVPRKYFQRRTRERSVDAWLEGMLDHRVGMFLWLSWR